MTKDPVPNHFQVPLRYRASTWITVILAMFAVAGVSLGLVAYGRSSAADRHTAQETKLRTQQLQDVICGVYVPIGNSPLLPGVTSLGRTIVAATRHGALKIHCPGVQ